MRIFVFALLFLAGTSLASAQPVPDLGPEAEPPSAEDFNALPDDLPEDGGQVVVDESDPEDEKSRLDELFANLAKSDNPK